MPHRPARTEDVPALRELARRAYAGYVPRIGREPAPMAADYVAAVAEEDVWVAEVGDRIAGLLVLVPRDDHLLLENVAVDPSFQGTGVGAGLLELAESRARSLGLGAIRLYTNEAMTENLTYYPRRGYVETHRAAQDGFNRVFFSKSLD